MYICICIYVYTHMLFYGVIIIIIISSSSSSIMCPYLSGCLSVLAFAVLAQGMLSG